VQPNENTKMEITITNIDLFIHSHPSAPLIRIKKHLSMLLLYHYTNRYIF
jgi:hypothetical protein